MNYRPVSKRIQRPQRVDPYEQGLDKKTVTALLTGRATAPERAKYYRTDWFKQLVAEAMDIHQGLCQVCGKKGKTMTFHHNRYGTLFNENALLDGILVCSRCHQRVHSRL
jgi:5-methylcytosine-specific restriction endonuclease McrA